MADQNYSYPLPSSQKFSLKFWLDTLPQRKISRKYVDGSMDTCVCCNFPRSLPEGDWSKVIAAKLHKDLIVELPCGCKYRRGCIEAKLSPRFGNEDHCPSCDFQLFKPWTLETFVQELEHVETITLESEDRCCGICLMEYSDIPPAAMNKENIEIPTENQCLEPVKLSCGHVFGAMCLLHWLSPALHGGNGKSCPNCREKLFRWK